MPLPARDAGSPLRLRRLVSTGLLFAAALALAQILALMGPAAALAKRPPRTLLVGSYHGRQGAYGSIQQAVDHAREGDWILIGPGDYKEASSRAIPGAQGDDRAPADVLITTPNIHIRGMDR